MPPSHHATGRAVCSPRRARDAAASRRRSPSLSVAPARRFAVFRCCGRWATPAIVVPRGCRSRSPSFLCRLKVQHRRGLVSSRNRGAQWPVRGQNLLETGVAVDGRGRDHRGRRPDRPDAGGRAVPGRSGCAGAGAASADPGDPEGRGSEWADRGGAALPRPAGAIRSRQPRARPGTPVAVRRGARGHDAPGRTADAPAAAPAAAARGRARRAGLRARRRDPSRTRGGRAQPG